MWLDYLHNNDPSGDSRHGRAKAKAVADFARLQQTVIRKARKHGESDAQIVELIEKCILGALLEERRRLIDKREAEMLLFYAQSPII